MKNDKKSIILTFVAAITLITVVLGATYAYFTAQTRPGVGADVTVQAGTTDSLSFVKGSDINLTATLATFGKTNGNITGNSTSTATLVPNNSIGSASLTYNVYLDITANTLEYTTESKTAELLLKVTDPMGSEVKKIEGLEYKTVTGITGNVAGFDITTALGLIKIEEGYIISTTNNVTVTQNWKVEVILVNLNSDQEKNTSKTFTASLNIQKEKSNTFADYIKSTYGTDSTLLLHDSNLTNGAGDNSYRYAGASTSVKNYVCFGSDATSCPTANIYRIIGVFGNTVKVIKNTSLESMAWDSAQVNTWSTSSLNKYLNETFLSTFGTTWQNKIVPTEWQVGGNVSSNIYSVTPKAAYGYEITSPAENIRLTTKIGLMYVSDYGYAASAENWTKPLGVSPSTDYRTITANNWMYSGLYEWTITRRSNDSYIAFRVGSYGDVSFDYVYNFSVFRPVFQLSSLVTLKSGEGTLNSPYRI